MRKYLIILAFMMLLMPIMHACSDDGSKDTGGGNTASNAMFSVTPAVLDFGAVDVESDIDNPSGPTTPLSVTITNITNTTVQAALKVLGVSWEGSQSTDDCISHNGASVYIAPGKSCTVTYNVRFAPKTVINGLPLLFHVCEYPYDYDNGGTCNYEIIIPIKYTEK